jgi:rfaE bifunctional protein nucleotidyltransferase chain/domain
VDYPFHIEQKIVRAEEELSRIIALWRFKKEKIVFTNGCFDILHRGHVEYLAKAAGLGSKLIIGLNTDDSVRQLKGASRPVNNEHDRALLLASLLFVDTVTFFDSDTPLDLIRYLQPDVLVKGGDYRPQEIVGHDVVQAKGGEVVTIPFLDGYSTTLLLNQR